MEQCVQNGISIEPLPPLLHLLPLLPLLRSPARPGTSAGASFPSLLGLRLRSLPVFDATTDVAFQGVCPETATGAVHKDVPRRGSVREGVVETRAVVCRGRLCRLVGADIPVTATHPHMEEQRRRGEIIVVVHVVNREARDRVGDIVLPVVHEIVVVTLRRRDVLGVDLRGEEIGRDQEVAVMCQAGIGLVLLAPRAVVKCNIGVAHLSKQQQRKGA